mgnify:CR=1 FL=1
MAQAKQWWQSKTIWLSIALFLLSIQGPIEALLSKEAISPRDISMAVFSALVAWARTQTTQEIK